MIFKRPSLKQKGKSLIFAGVDCVTRAALRKTYEVAFALALLLPAKNERAKRERARKFALKVRENTEKHGPIGIAMLVNAAVLTLMGMTTLTRAGRDKSGDIEATIENFVQAPEGKPPGGGGGGGSAALAEALAPTAQLSVSTPTSIPSTQSAITTTAPSSLQFDVPSSNVAQLTSAMATATASVGKGGAGTGSGQGSGQGNGNGAGIGPGSGTGQGGGNGAGQGAGTGSGRGSQKGNGGTTLRGLAGWDLVVLIDQSTVVGDAGGFNPNLSVVRMNEASKMVSPVKVNASLLPNILAQKNNILELVIAADDNLFQSKEEDRSKGILDIKINDIYRDLGRATVVLPAYASRKNTAVIIGSEFQWQASECSKEERDQVEAQLLSYNLPIFFISLGARPDDFIREIARKSGGGYLGFISASNAKSMPKDVDKSWTCIMKNGLLTYERRTPPQVRSNEIVAPLEESSQGGLTLDESIQKGKAQRGL